jgi:hypothetical protein
MPRKTLNVKLTDGEIAGLQSQWSKLPLKREVKSFLKRCFILETSACAGAVLGLP